MLSTESFSTVFPFVGSAVSGLSGNERILYQAASLMCDVSTALVEYRRKNKLTQKELAERLNVGQPMISKYESGDYNWTIRSLVEVSSKLGMNLTLSLEEKETPSQLGIQKESPLK